MRPARLGGGGGWERAADAVPARLSAQEHAAKNALTSFCTPEPFLSFSFEASRRPGGGRSGPGRRILFFRTRLLQTQPSQFCVSESVELNAPCRPTRAREAASAPQQVARCLPPPIGSRAAPAPPLCSRARATPRHIVPILHSTAQHHGRHALRRLAERRHQKGRGLRKRCAALRANHDLRPRPASLLRRRRDASTHRTTAR